MKGPRCAVCGRPGKISCNGGTVFLCMKDWSIAAGEAHKHGGGPLLFESGGLRVVKTPERKKS